jgi:hypothetical protein
VEDILVILTPEVENLMSGRKSQKKNHDDKRTSHTRAFRSRIPMACNIFPCGKRSAGAVSYVHSAEGSIGSVKTIQAEVGDGCDRGEQITG